MRSLLAVVAVLVVCCGPAAAGTFPGGNGLIAFSRTSAPPSIPVLVAFDPATGSEHQIGTGTAPAWSPDGTHIAYVRDGNVLVANADGSGERGLGPGDTPSWSPDGTRLVVARTDGTLYVVDAGGG